jgi:iron-sulfur cluster insertion protein
MSLELINGAEVDYQSSVNGESFVIRNPNAGSSCGCGKSFTPAETGTGCANNTGY